MKEIYIVIWKDRHCDDDAIPFSTEEKAISFAKAKAREYDRFNDLAEILTEPMKSDGWLYYGSYSCEGDCLYVVKRTIDKEDS